MEAPTEHPLRAHWPWPQLAIGALSAFATFVIWNRWIGPVDTIPMQPPDSPDFWGGSSLLWVLAPVPVLVLAYRWKRWWVAILAALIAPVIMVGVAIGISDELRWQREARDVFNAYTHRFPPSELGTPEIIDQYESVIDMCATRDPGKEAETKRFCLDLVMNRPRGEQVTGGYQTREFDYTFRSDCFGESEAVGECD